jgi:formate C-acetyltransferase
VISLFTEGCIENGRLYYEGGPKYTVVSPHIGGLADTANSLYAIKKFVFEEKRMELSKFLSILKNNWEGEEILRLNMRNQYAYFGNDNEEVDIVAARIVEDFAKAIKSADNKSPVFTPPGISTFGRQIDWQWVRAASPHGYKKGDVLAGNFSPTPGTDKKGATAIIKSHCKPDLSKMTTGASLDIKLFPTLVEGEQGLGAIIDLIRGFVNLGGYFMNVDVIDNGILLEAQQHPEEYKSLSVRISGWSARFVTLDEKWQNMVIERTAQRM